MALPATDNFNRTSGGLGTNWTTITGQGAPQIVSSTIVNTNALGTDSAARWNADSFPNDQYTQVKVVTAATATTRGAGGILRGASAANSFYRVLVAGPLGASATVNFAKMVTGTFTPLTSTTMSVASNDILKGTVIGTQLRAYINGSEVTAIATTDSAHSAGSAGVAVYVDTGSTTEGALDDWEGGDATVVVVSGPGAAAPLTETPLARFPKFLLRR